MSKNILILIFLIISNFAKTQDIFEYDKVITYVQKEEEFNARGRILVDSNRVEIEYKGFTNYNVIKNLLNTTGKNLHYKQLHYKLDNDEEMVICYHNDRLYAVIIHTWVNNNYTNIKYLKTKW
jgi:hypothetical protein